MCYDDVMEYELIKCGNKTFGITNDCDFLTLGIIIAKSYGITDVESLIFKDEESGESLELSAKIADHNYICGCGLQEWGCRKLNQKITIAEEAGSRFLAYELFGQKMTGFDAYEIMDAVRAYEGKDPVDTDEELFRELVADLVFNDEIVNAVYCPLAEAVGINEAYEQIVTVYMECVALDLDEEAFDEEFMFRLDELKIFSENID